MKASASLARRKSPSCSCIASETPVSCLPGAAGMPSPCRPDPGALDA
jgi:hypothetical protein